MSKYSFKHLISLLIFILILSTFPESLFAQYNDKRIVGNERYETAVAISKQGFPSGAETVVLARGDLFPDALAGAPLATHYNSPILLTRSDKLPISTLQEIKRLKAKKVIILGGTKAISETILNDIKKLELSVERISGPDRYSTSVEIAKRLNADKDQVIVTTGRNFPDALAIAPYAAENGIPILLTLPDKLHSSVATEVKKYKNTTLIGGTNAIQENVKRQLPNATRISGTDRYQTALQIIDTFYEKTDHIYLSTGRNFPDALTGSVLAANNKTGVLLVNPTKLSSGTEALVGKKQMKDYQVFGGTQAVPDTVVKEFTSLLALFKDAIGSAEFSEEVILLTPPQTDAFRKAGSTAELLENGAVKLKMNKAIVNQFTKGQVVFIEPDAIQPTGFIGQIIAINKESGTITLAQPAFDEILDFFDISAEDSLTANDIIDFELKEGVSLDFVGHEVNSIQEFQSLLTSIGSFQSETDSHFSSEPVTFNVNATLLERGQNKIKLLGSYKLLDAKSSIQTSKGWLGGLKSFDYDFEANQKANVDVVFTWSDGIKIPSREVLGTTKMLDWVSLEGVDRSDRFPIASLTYQIGTAPFYGVGNKGYIPVPIGVTVFISASLSGDMEASASIGVIQNNTYKFGVDWENSSKEFRTSSDFHRHKLDLVTNGSAKGDAKTGFGLEGAVNIAGLLPAVVQNDILIHGTINGNGSLIVDLRGNNSPSFSGCIDASLNAGFESVLKARLVATFFMLESGLSYEKKIFSHDFFNKGFKLCEQSGLIQGTITDAVTTESIKDVLVVANKDGVFHKSVKSNEDGSYILELKHGKYDLVFKKANYQDIVYRNVEVKKDEIFYSPELKLIGSEYKGVGTITGTIKDARTGRTIEAAIINIRSGFNTSTGPILKTVKTDNQGNYKVENIAGGAYTAELVKEGYNSSYFDIISIGGQTRSNQNGTMNPIIPDGELVVVLTWGEHPFDLDAHFTGPTRYNERFHIDYTSMSYYEDEKLVANLDVDERFSYGPETVTLHEQTSGEYRYYVQDYTNIRDVHSRALSNSGAKVEVYRGNTLLRSFNVPNKEGDIWHVFNLSGNTITPVNKLGGGFELQSTDRVSDSQSEIELIRGSTKEKE